MNTWIMVFAEEEIVNVDNNFSSMDSVVTALLMRLLRELI
jgi:hypothetical protein